MDSEKVAVMRMLLYVGDRKEVEEAVANSIHGTRMFKHENTKVTITAVTIHEFPNVIEEARNIADPSQIEELTNEISTASEWNREITRQRDELCAERQVLIEKLKKAESELTKVQKQKGKKK